jgi:Cd2+/Zn2+-exporting ATPase
MATTAHQLTLQIQGLDCPNCARSVETGVSQLAGVQSCELNFTTAKLRVTGSVNEGQVIERVRALGYDVLEPQVEASAAGSTRPLTFFQFLWQRRETQLALFGFLLILPAALLTEVLGLRHPLLDLASVGALLVAGLPVARSAWRSLWLNREININVLMTIAGIGAVFIGEYTEAGLVMVLFALGEALEGYTGQRARDAIRSLMQLAPHEATLLRQSGGQPQEWRIQVAALQIGDIILVKPGESIPMDGRVRAGSSLVNQAPITGESRLVEKVVGSEVFASSINGEGHLEIEVTHLAGDNTISRMIQMVEEAQEKRAPAQRFVDRFAKYYTPAVVGLALLTAIIPSLFFGQPFLNPGPDSFGWLYRGLALLVVACPCALVISTPVSIISAISNAARSGVLIKGGAYLEALSRIKAVIFDKTGTLTEGKPVVIAVQAVDCQNRDGNLTGNTASCAACYNLLAIASAVERRSEHPIAQAIVTEAEKFGLHDKYPAAEMVTALTGRGVTGQVNGRQVTIGSHAYFDAYIPHHLEACQKAQQDAAQGYTLMMVSAEGQYLGLVSVADTVRPSSQEAVTLLKQGGVKTVIMLTGDNAATAQQIGRQVGVTDIRAGLLPENKVAAVKSLQVEYGPVAMIGDGINDAPALATADVGIAIGGANGSTQAMETADITLMSNDLRQLPFIFRLSRAMMNIIRTNIILSLGIKLLFLGLVVFGLGTMWMAVLADMGTSLLVTFNGMRLLNQPKSKLGRS